MKALLLCIFATKVFCIKNELVKPDKSKFTDGTTNDVALDYKSFSSCPCDITKNSCDVYCKCDDDCATDVKFTWDTALNYINVAYKPQQRCIDRSEIYHYNIRMGMKLNDDGKKLCVELDSGT